MIPRCEITLRRLALPFAMAALLSASVSTSAGATPAALFVNQPSIASSLQPARATSAPRSTKAAAVPTAPLAPPSPDLPDLAAMSPELADVAVDSASFRRASAAYREVAEDHTAAQAARAALDLSTTEARAQTRTAQAHLGAARARAAALQSRLDQIEAAVAELSVRLYVSGGSLARFDAALTQERPSIDDHDRRAVLGEASMDVLLAERAAFGSRLAEAQGLASAAVEVVQSVTSTRSAATRERGSAVEAEVRTARRVAAERVRYEEARALGTVDGVDFTLVALDAYHRAAQSVGEEDPACGIRWWALAGISRVEGRHGTYGGANLDARGDTTKHIIGMQLNGTHDTAVIGDSDGGALDGDAMFDRAVGPMQFIPQTWSRFEADGNDDGTSTPFNMYDATLAAARYLCTASSALDGDPGLRAAYFSYNHSQAYVDRVLSFARGYEAELEPLTPTD